MAQTPWGELPVSDAHIHFFSHSFFSKLAKQRSVENAEQLGSVLDWDIPSPNPADLAAQWSAELDRYGVQRAALIGSLPGEEDAVSAAVRAYTNRFVGFFMLDPTQPDAMTRMQTALGGGGLRCLCLFPGLHGYSVSDARFVPLFQAAADLRAIVFVHCGALTMGVRKKLGLPTPVDYRKSNPIDVQPVAQHFPQIRFIIPHFGGGFFREALMLADACPNVFLDTSSSNRWMAYEELELRHVFRRAIGVIGVERILFGSDSSFFPRGWNKPHFDTQVTAMYEMGLTQEQAKVILSDNFISLFYGGVS